MTNGTWTKAFSFFMMAIEAEFYQKISFMEVKTYEERKSTSIFTIDYDGSSDERLRNIGDRAGTAAGIH